MQTTKILVGDIVSVNFHNNQFTLCERGVVEYVPLSQGDSWVIFDKDSGKLHYVSEPCTVTLNPDEQ